MDRQLQFPETLKQYLSQDTLTCAFDNVDRIQTHIETWLSPFEPRIMSLQSLLVWEKPWHSLTAAVISFILFWFLCTDHIVGVLCFLLLTLYWCYLWKEQIWPTIRVPIPSNEQEQWVPVHADLLTLSDISYYAARNFVFAQAVFEALWNLRIQRKSVFVVVMYLEGCLALVIGHYFSGFTIFTIILFSALLLPGIIYHNVFSTVYTQLQPYLTSLQNWLATKFTICRPNEGRHRQVATGSEEDLRSALQAAHDMQAEDENVGGDNSSLDNNGDLEEEQGFLLDELVPDVSLMPDFEGVCDESQALFMLEADVMPSLNDDVDRSRFDPSFIPAHNDNTDSETESLPFDDSTLGSEVSFDEEPSRPFPAALAASAPAFPVVPPASQPSHVSQTPAEPSAPEAPAGYSLDALTEAASRFAAGMFSAWQPNNDLRQDPRDRIADASVEDDLEGSLAFQESDEFDYEIISRDEVN